MKTTFGIIVGNRGFFPDELARKGRTELIGVLKSMGFQTVCLTGQDTKFGSVETRQDAQRCAELFRANARRIDGVIVTLPNFGDERGIAEALRLADLKCPVLIQASPDDPKAMDLARRRDSFCGKISACCNLQQYGIPFTLTARHTVAPADDEFRREVQKFAAVCRVVNGFKNVRVGAIGTRPAAFNTVRYSEKILERRGISVEPIDLSEIFVRARRLADSDRKVARKVAAIKNYCSTRAEEHQHLVKMAKLAVVIDQFVAENNLDVCAIQCWTSIEENYGVVPCAIMSMMNNALVPSACEVDVGGALAMYAMQLATGTASTLLDWNNNYGDDPDKCVLFHCSNTPKHFLKSIRIEYQAILAATVGKENAYGACAGRIKSGPMTFARLTTDDARGVIRAYVGEGAFTDDATETFGGYGVVKIAGLQRLLQFVCRNGFEHHVAASLSKCADVLNEAFTTYLGIETYYHK